MIPKVRLTIKLSNKPFEKFSLADYTKLFKLKQQGISNRDYYQWMKQQSQKLRAPQCYQEAVNRLSDGENGLQTRQHILERQRQKQQILEYLEKSLSTKGNSSPLYISGVPGIGKTATVIQTLQQFHLKYPQKIMAIYINGMKLRTPQKIYEKLLRKLTKLKTSNPVEALNLLFNSPDKFPNIDKELKQRVKIIVLDEIDQLTDNRSQVIYNFLEWAHNIKSKIVLIGISNTVDLPSRLSHREQSRMHAENLIFKVFQFDQILRILEYKLDKYCILFEEIALKYVTKKISQYSSDMRIIMNVCARALQIAFTKYMERKIESPKLYQVTIQDIKQSMYCNIQEKLISGLKESHKLMLIILSSLTFQTNLAINQDSTTLVINKFKQMMTRIERKAINITYGDILRILKDLSDIEAIKLVECQKSQNKSLIRILRYDVGLLISLKKYIESDQVFKNFQNFINN